MSTYLLINILTISFPLLRSFESKIRFAKEWKSLSIAIILTGSFFIVWDVFFTKIGVWGFNPLHLQGITIFELPLEEWLFFLTVPYACLFIYEVMNFFVKKDMLGKYAKTIAWTLGAFLFLIGIYHNQKWYTSVTFILTSILLGYSGWKQPKYLGRFFIAFFVCLIPFLIVNGVLTGSMIVEEVVWYNNNENLGLRIGTIPVEDTIYALLLLLMNTMIYEQFKTQDK